MQHNVLRSNSLSWGSDVNKTGKKFAPNILGRAAKAGSFPHFEYYRNPSSDQESCDFQYFHQLYQLRKNIVDLLIWLVPCGFQNSDTARLSSVVCVVPAPGSISLVPSREREEYEVLLLFHNWGNCNCKQSDLRLEEQLRIWIGKVVAKTACTNANRVSLRAQQFVPTIFVLIFLRNHKYRSHTKG